MRELVSRTDCAPRQSQRLAEELPHLLLLAVPREQDRQVVPQYQRALVLYAEPVSLLGENFALDFRDFSVLALS